MSRSLAFVGILAIISVAATWSAVAQSNSDQPTTVVKTHMSDSERDRLMQEAMEKARKELEAKKAREASDAQKAIEREKRKEEARIAAEAAADKLAAEKSESDKRKADEERLAKELAEKEKNTTENSRNELKPLTSSEKPVNLDEVKKTTTADKDKDSHIKTVSTEKKLVVSGKTTEKKPAVSEKKEPSKSEDEPKANSKTVVEVLPTKEPGHNLTLKTSESDSKSLKDSDKDVSFHARESASRSESNGNDSSLTVKGAVVGLMRSTDRAPRILVQDERGRMVQVVLEDDAKIPVSGSRVTIRGRNIGGGPAGQVISSSSINIESGTTVRPQPETAQANRIPAPVMGPPMGMMPPPVGMLPPPMVMGGPMMPPPLY